MLLYLFRFFENLISPFNYKVTNQLPKSLTGFLLFFSKGLYGFFFLAAFLNSLIAIGEALFFVSLGYIVDWTTSTAPYDFLNQHGNSLLIMLVTAGVILPIASIFHSLLIHQTLQSNYAMIVRYQLHTHLLDQSVSFFNDQFAGSLANKVMQTSMAVRTAVMKLMDVVVHLIVYIATIFVMLANANLSLCIPILVWLTLYVSSIFVFIPRLRKASKVSSDQRSVMVGRIVDSYTNISTVKLFGGHGREKHYAKEAMNEFRQSEYKALRVLTLFDISVQLMNYTMLIALVMLSLYLWSFTLVTPGAIAIAIAIAIRLINMSRWIMFEVGAIYENLGMVYDAISSVVKPISVQDPNTPKQLLTFNDSICFENVAFAYADKANILDNFSLKIKKGQRVGIVGPSGAGKTTIINLLLRFFDVKAGRIVIDGTDIREIKQDDLRDLFSMVTQDASLMHRTIGQNIKYGTDEELDESELLKVARDTDSLSFIENLSDYRGGNGFDTLVGDRGVKLSGGQKQRIALARVMVKNAPILILDEATSALDSKSEKIIQENLEKIMKDRTVIAVAHRLSTLKSMDFIVVIDHGRVVQIGSHSELLENSGLYKQLWDLQTDGFIS
ncbi:MAG: ABC transporter ATP-binding protein [Succinivibrio sp.]|nr:ABC transporter ATP-binding protein [Succinivibrio sp.]